MLFGFPFIADWKKIGEHRQRLTDCDTACENIAGLITTTKLVRKYLYGMMVYFAKQKIPGQS
jgi:hypothetical protein